MAVITIAHNPDLTADQAFETFQRSFDGKYDVYKTRIRNRDFVVKRSAWAGVGVRLKQAESKTSFVFTATMPNVILQGLFGGLATYLFLRPQWKSLESEIAGFIKEAPEFQAPRLSVVPSEPVQDVPSEPVEDVEPAGEPAAEEPGKDGAAPEQPKAKPKQTRRRRQPRKRKAA